MKLLDRERSVLLERGCWGVLATVAAYELYKFSFVSWEVAVLAVLTCAAAVLPWFLWVRGRVPGYPLFPVMALTYLWTYGLPALNQQPAVAAYPPGRQVAALGAALTFLLVATAVWLAVVRVPARQPARLLQFDRSATVPLLLAGLAGATLFQLNNAVRVVRVPPGVGSILSALFIALVSVAAPTLAFLFGLGRLSHRQVAAFLALFGAHTLISLTSLHVSTAVTLLVALLTYSIARGRVPLVLLGALVLALSVLHLGKKEMRARYWAQSATLRPWDYPGFFYDWATAGVRRAVAPAPPSGRTAWQDPLERSSLLWVMLRLQEQIPAHKPYLNGETYQIIPELLVPRVLNESKIVAVRGNQVLAVYSGMIRKEDVRRVSIGFGYLAEAYANFGWVGVLALAVLVGAALGQLTRWSADAPVISFRGTLTLLVLAACVQAEYTAGVLVSSLFQHTAVLGALCLALMRPLPAAEGARRTAPAAANRQPAVATG
jgi:hypothetical protein